MTDFFRVPFFFNINIKKNQSKAMKLNFLNFDVSKLLTQSRGLKFSTWKCFPNGTIRTTLKICLFFSLVTGLSCEGEYPPRVIPKNGNPTFSHVVNSTSERVIDGSVSTMMIVSL